VRLAASAASQPPTTSHEAVALLASQPRPDGGRVAIVSNAGGAGVLAADACSDAGLHAVVLDRRVQDGLRGLLPPVAEVTGPVDTTAAATPGVFRRCLELVAEDDGVDAVLALTVRTAMGDLVPAAGAAAVSKPLVLSVLNQAEGVRLLPAGPEASGRVPAYAHPGSAARALAHAARYAAWRARIPGRVVGFAGLRSDDARALIGRFLGSWPDGGWLPPDQAGELLACYGIAVAGERPVTSDLAAAARPGSPAAPGGGTEVIIGVAQEPVFGPLVIFGLGGIATDVLGDRSARLTPLTDTDAAALIRSIRAAPLLLGRRGARAADLAALQDLLMRVSRLAEDLPQVAELELNPVMAGPDRVYVADARARVVPAQPADPYLRRLR
jgi:acyl-CoA synthetase (NDP forming)